LSAALHAAGAPAAAAVYASQQGALAEAFPDADRIDAHSVALDDEQAAAVEARARVKLETRIWTIHEARRGDTLLGSAVIDVHNVRTLPQALLVVLTPAGALRSVRVLAFHEPTEYQATPRWLAQFEGRALGPGLALQRDIHVLAGATLTSQAVLRSVRTVLALHEVLAAPPPNPAGR
jgi:hypothetical protein